MAATELTGVTPRRAGTRTFSCEIGLSWLCAYAGVWGATLAAGGIVALVGGALSTASRQLLGLALTPAHNPPPHLVHVFVLAAHNIPIVAWPLLLGLAGADRHSVSRHVADSVVLVCTLANTIPVGAALGAYGTPLIAYIPQLPLEWAGLALGLGSWPIQRRLPISTRQRLLCLALIIALMLAAGTLETLAVPHR